MRKTNFIRSKRPNMPIQILIQAKKATKIIEENQYLYFYHEIVRSTVEEVAIWRPQVDILILLTWREAMFTNPHLFKTVERKMIALR